MAETPVHPTASHRYPRIHPAGTRPAHAATCALIASLALVGCSREQAAPSPAAAAPDAAATPEAAVAPEPPTPPSASGPVTVTSVDLGTTIAPGGRTTRPTLRFAPDDPIHAVVSTEAPDAATPYAGRLTARWTYQDGQPVDETSRDFRFTGPGTVYFTVVNPGGWPAGDYRLEILLDGELVQTRGFEVR